MVFKSLSLTLALCVSVCVHEVGRMMENGNRIYKMWGGNTQYMGDKRQSKSH